MTTYTIDSKSYAKLFRSVESKRQDDVHSAVREAAMLGTEAVVVPAIKASVHRYTGALIASAHTVKTPGGGAEIRVDAPHAGVIEGGARPHMPPLQPLLDWVRVNLAFFDLKAPKQGRVMIGPVRTAAQQLRRDFSALRQNLFEQAVNDIANAIRWKIYKHGSPPHWFMRNSLPKLREILKATVEKRMAGGARE
jgi:hypothetical protein